MQDLVINEGKDPPESFNCCSPKCNDEAEVLKLKDDIIFALEDIGVGPNYYPFLEVYNDTFSNLGNNVQDTLEKLENYLKENGALKQQLKKYVEAEKVVSELKPQLEEKENEIKKLKTEFNDQTEETKKLHD